MKISTVNTIYWISVAGFWSLLIANLATPGKPPVPLGILEELFLLALVATYFYVAGTNRKASTPTYEMSN